MTTVVLMTPATKLPVSLAETKDWLKFPHSETEDDAQIDQLIRQAVNIFERHTGVALITQTWKQYQDGFGTEIHLRRGPVQSISQIDYIDTDGNSQTLSSAVYQTDLVPQPPHNARIKVADGQSWPSIRSTDYNPVTVTFVAGYGSDFNNVAPERRAALMQLAAHLYNNPESFLDMRNDFMAVPAGAVDQMINDRLTWAF